MSVVSATSAWVRSRARSARASGRPSGGRRRRRRPPGRSRRRCSRDPSRSERTRARASIRRRPPRQRPSRASRPRPAPSHPTGVRSGRPLGRRLTRAGGRDAPTLARWLDPAARPGRSLGLGPRAVLVPVKAFDRRQAPSAPGPERAPSGPTLARAMADRVLDAARPLPVAVVCDDNDVADWARGAGRSGRLGTGTRPERGGRGRRRPPAHGRGRAGDRGPRRPAPGQSTCPRWASAAGITLVPDRYGNGTNVIALPADAGFQFSYGPGSFARHRAEAGAARAPAAGARPSGPGLGRRRAGRRGAGAPLPARAPSGDRRIGARSRPGDAERAAGRRPPCRPGRRRSTSSRAGQCAGRRRPPRRHRVRVRRHPGQVGGGRLPGPPPGPHRRVQGELGPGAPISTAGRGACGRVPRGRGRRPSRRCDRRAERERRAEPASGDDAEAACSSSAGSTASSTNGPAERREVARAHPHAASRRAPRSRPLAPVPAPPRPPGGRLPHPRRAGGRPRPALLPRTGLGPAPTRGPAPVRGRPAQPRRRAPPASRR